MRLAHRPLSPSRSFHAKIDHVPVSGPCMTRPELPRPDLDRAFFRDVLAGLSAPRKSLSCKYFYDEAGAELFERICRLAEYYPTRCELAILQQHASAIMALVEPG